MLQKRGVTHHGWAEWTWRLAGTGGAPAGQGAGGAAVAPDTVRAVEDAILTRARQLRVRDGQL